MAAFGFDTLALVVVVGTVGPLLASVRPVGVPVVIGELAAGVLIGRTGLGLVDHADPAFRLLADVGFALVMFVVGTHIPMRDTALRSVLRPAAIRAVAVGAVAAAFGAGAAHLFGTGHALLYAVIMASSSAALALPIIDSMALTGPSVVSVTAQIAIADIAAIVALPLVIDPPRAIVAAAGAVAVAAGAGVIWVVLRAADRRGWRRRLHRYSRKHRLALELRVSLTLLFTLCALAIGVHVSIMLAGFALGLVVSAVGEPRRLARQLFGVTEGFFSPMFFVWLGASLDIRELWQRPMLIALGVALGLGALLAHSVGRLAGQPLTLAILAGGQLGVPVAAAALGADADLLGPGEPAALIMGALVTVAATSVAAVLAARRQRAAADAA